MMTMQSARCHTFVLPALMLPSLKVEQDDTAQSFLRCPCRPSVGKLIQYAECCGPGNMKP